MIILYGKEESPTVTNTKLSTPHPITEAVEWYKAHYESYARLAERAANLLEEALETANIPYHSVVWRTKTVTSYKQKALTRGFLQPRSQISDMSGIRVITFVQSDADATCRVIERLFPIIQTERKAAGSNGFGYRSVHYMAQLPSEQTTQPAYADLKGMPIEIQVRTLLQNAWAEIEHDRNYKFEGTLPPELQRRFSMLAAVLELADREFEAIALAIDEYVESIKAQAAKGNLNIPINTTALREYLLSKFPELTPLPLSPRFATRRDAEEIVREMLGMGIDTLSKLDAIIPPDFSERAREHLELTTPSGIIRDLLIIHDANAYFRVTRRQHSQPIGPDSLALYSSYGLDAELIRLQDAATTPEAFWREMRDAK